MSNYTRILEQVWQDKSTYTNNNAPTFITNLTAIELKNRRLNEFKINKFNKLGRSKILIVENDKDTSIKYYFVSANYERFQLTSNDPVSMAIYIMAIRKMYDLSDYKATIEFYHQLVNKPYRTVKKTINRIILGLPKHVAELL